MQSKCVFCGDSLTDTKVNVSVHGDSPERSWDLSYMLCNKHWELISWLIQSSEEFQPDMEDNLRKRPEAQCKNCSDYIKPSDLCFEVAMFPMGTEEQEMDADDKVYTLCVQCAELLMGVIEDGRLAPDAGQLGEVL